MKGIIVALVAALVGNVMSLPMQKRQSANLTADDITVLQFALFLEHLENVFYKGALSIFSVTDFIEAGFSSELYNDVVFIAQDEEIHVQTLTTVLQGAGVAPVAACNYSFPISDVQSFISLSSVLEGVGVSAYNGAASLLASKDILTVAASIMSVEAQHNAVQRGTLNQAPAPNAFGTPLDPNAVFTLATSFVQACPSTNMALPFKAFQGLTFQSSGSTPTAGSLITLTAQGEIAPDSFVTFVSGISVVSVAGSVNGQSISVQVPTQAEGQTYVFISNSDVETTFSESAVLFGPAIVEVTPPPPTLNINIL